MKYIIIKADTNDGDYVTEVSLITDEQIEKIRPVIEAIKSFVPSKEHGHNWPTGEMAYYEGTPEIIYQDKLGRHLINLFNDFVPEGDPNYPGIYTIESVKIVELIETLL